MSEPRITSVAHVVAPGQISVSIKTTMTIYDWHQILGTLEKDSRAPQWILLRHIKKILDSVEREIQSVEEAQNQ